MSDMLSFAVQGLTNAIASIANATSNMVNASSTQNLKSNLSDSRAPASSSASPGLSGASPQDLVDIATNLIAIDAAKIHFAANAKVLAVADKNLKSLIDIKT